ncbi:hypothetical protein ABT236_34900 [Streptomyces sp. NPDC001523]|uniref:hypothetical protein n=1 Tax=Streptomyces sp. NPDC001523 TaxID=3154383 RepID=UPI00332F0B05
MEIPGPSARWRMLIEAVVLVASPAAAQRAWLEKYDVPPEEIFLGFDDAFRLAGELVREGMLSATALSHLRMIDEIHGEMARDEGTDRWTSEALSADAEWNRARWSAREVLTAEGQTEGEGDARLPDPCIVR